MHARGIVWALMARMDVKYGAEESCGKGTNSKAIKGKNAGQDGVQIGGTTEEQSTSPPFFCSITVYAGLASYFFSLSC